MSKHGVLALTRTLAAEWAARGVRVNAIAPGFFMTALNRDKMSPTRKEIAMRRTPMKRFGEVEELVGAAIYLASPSASYVTGETIAVDGGFLAAGLD
jgi:NAD(P)-dependent dehydrogenase (short-subunit alcohol dehydrogenase family)